MTDLKRDIRQLLKEQDALLEKLTSYRIRAEQAERHAAELQLKLELAQWLHPGLQGMG